MYGSSSPASSKDLNLPFPPPAVPSFGGHRKEGSDLHRRHRSQQQQQQPSPQQQQQMSSGLLRYRSAPSSLLGEVCDDFLPVRPSSPETDNILARFLTPDLRDEIRDKPGGGGQRSPQFSPAPPPPSSAAMDHGAASEASGQQNGGFASSASAHLLYQQQQQQLANQSAVESAYRGVVSSTAMEAEQMKNAATSGGGNCSNLVRHSSSPAGLFAHLNVENGYAMMRGMGGGFRNGGGSMGDGANRLKGQISFSSRQNSATGLMSQISEVGSEGMGVSSPEDGSFGGASNGGGGGGGRCFIPGYPITSSSWDDSRLLSGNFSGMKRAREEEEKIIAGLNPSSELQNGEARSHAAGLAHQFSLPKTSSEMAAIEKFLQFQDAVPCKIRAKRGCATHPRSIAERVRRTRISERMRKLQELVPNMDKQTNTADMLDLAVDYIKDLQKQVKSLSDSRASCSCSAGKEKPYSNQAA